MKERETIGASQGQEEQFHGRLRAMLTKHGLSEEQQSAFIGAISPKLEELGAVTKGYIANGRPGHDRKLLEQLSKQLSKLIRTYRGLGWYARDDLLDGIEIRASADLLDELMDLQTRRHEVYPLGWDLDSDYDRALKDGTLCVGSPEDDSLTFALSVIQRRAHAEAQANYRHLCGNAAGDEAKAAFAPEFVDIGSVN